MRSEAADFYLVMSQSMIRNNWPTLLLDPDNPRPDIKDADEWIALAKSGTLKTLGATIVIQDKLPLMTESDSLEEKRP